MWVFHDDMGKVGANADTLQTLRFVQSLPKRERQPLSNKFKNADPLGKLSVLRLLPVTDRISD